MQNPGDSFLEELFKEWLADDMASMRLINEENKVFQAIRESHAKDLMMVEQCRELLFENAKNAEHLSGRIADVKRRIKELGRVPG